MPAVPFKVNAKCSHHIPEQKRRLTNWPAMKWVCATAALKDRRLHRVATLFGTVAVRLPRFRCVSFLLPVEAGTSRHPAMADRCSAVARVDTEIAVIIRRNLAVVGRAADADLTAFTDGAPGLRSILSKAGRKKPIEYWFHIAMRLQHAKQVASGLPTDTPGRMQAKAVIVPEVERLRWRIWNGKAKNARRTLKRVRKVMHVF